MNNNEMDDFENIDPHLNQFIENNKEEKEINKLVALLDYSGEWFDFVVKINNIHERFTENMDSLNLAIENQKDKSDFLNGILFIGIISAYEGFIHELLNALCEKTKYIKKARIGIKTLTIKDRQHFRLPQKKISDEDLKNKLLNATLNDPIQITRIAYTLFKINFPVTEKEFKPETLKIRNSFTHNNGFLDGKYTEINYNLLKEHHAFFKNTVEKYISKIVNESNLSHSRINNSTH